MFSYPRSTMPSSALLSRSQTAATRSKIAQIDSAVSLELLTNSCGHMTGTSKSDMLKSLSGLPLELIQKIYHECSDIKSVVHLSATSRKFRAAYNGSQKLIIIEMVLQRQFGPLHEAIQVVTYNASQPAHVPRKPAISMALAQQVTAVGYVVQTWEEIYPLLRWRVHSEYRRALRTHEAFRFRRAMYRLWLYSKAFHNSDYLELERGVPRPASKDQRLTYLRRLHDDEIVELAELHDVLHDMLHNDLCPSNAIIQQRYNQGFPNQPPLYFGTYETYPMNGAYDSPFQKIVYKRDLPRDLVGEAWGTWEMQYSAVRDILKLEPDELLHFRDKLPDRAERMSYLASMHESFHQNPSTLRGAIEAVIAERDLWITPSHGTDGGIVDFLDETGCQDSDVPSAADTARHRDVSKAIDVNVDEYGVSVRAESELEEVTDEDEDLDEDSCE